MRHILLFATFFLLTIVWDVEFRFRYIFRGPHFPERIARRVSAVPRRILSLTRFFLDFDVIYEIKKGLDIPKHCLIVSNHQSILDIPLMAYCFPENNVRFTAKHTLFHHVPLVSQVLRMQRHARIDRTGKFSKTMKELERLARESAAGLSPVIFPEGTRSRSGELGIFHAGAIRKIETITPLPILGVALDGGYKISKMRELLGSLRGKRYRLKALSVYPPPGSKADIERVIFQIREEIDDQLAIWRSGELHGDG